MNLDENIEQETERIKKRGKIGCLICLLLVLVIPVVVIGKVFYEMSIEERTLEISHSPNNNNTIKVVQRGEAFLLGPSTVVVYYGNQAKELSVGNDGATVQPSNVTVSWQNDHRAKVTIHGESSKSVMIEF